MISSVSIAVLQPEIISQFPDSPKAAAPKNGFNNYEKVFLRIASKFI